MPLLRLETSVALPEDKRKALLASLSKAVAETIGKPEQYVMVTASQVAMLMSGKPGDRGPPQHRRTERRGEPEALAAGLQIAQGFPRDLPRPCLPEFYRRRSGELGLERKHF